MHEAKVKKERRQKIIREHRKMEVKLVAEGKTPYYLKERDIKKLELAEEYENVKKRLGSAADLEKFIEKKRKRKASKQKRFIPNRDYDAE
jgi:ribosomal RNA-processing protein 36